MTLTLTTNQSVDRSVFDEKRDGLKRVAPMEVRAIQLLAFAICTCLVVFGPSAKPSLNCDC